MKILMISNMYPSENNPSYGVFVRGFERGLASSGVVIDKVVIIGRGHSLIEKALKYVLFFWATTRSLTNAQYDLIYVHGVGLSLLPLLWVSAKQHLVVNAHGSDVLPVSAFGRLIKNFVQRTVRNADLVVVPSVFFANAVSDQFSVLAEKIVVSPSGGVDTELFRPSISRRSGGMVTFGYVSRIDKGKGWDVLLDAVNVLVSEGLCEFEVLIVGGGDQLDVLRVLVVEFALSDRVKVVGAVPHAALVEYFHCMDFFIFPTMLNESLGLVGLEAMACGVPVIGSDIGGLSGYIQPGVNGATFSPGDSVGLAAEMKKALLLDANKKNHLSRGALNTSKKYSSRVVSAALKIKLLELVNKNRG